MACGSLGALRPRLSPGLPFSRSPLGEWGDPAELLCCTCLKRNGRQPLANVSSRWRPGGRSDQLAVVPWLCVTVFRRFCSEQRWCFHVAQTQQVCRPRITCEESRRAGKSYDTIKSCTSCNLAYQLVLHLAVFLAVRETIDGSERREAPPPPRPSTFP